MELEYKLEVHHSLFGTIFGSLYQVSKTWSSQWLSLEFYHILTYTVGFYDQQYQMPFASLEKYHNATSSKAFLIVSIMLIIERVVEYLYSKPNYNYYIT